MRGALRKRCVDEWIIRTVMVLYTKACTVVVVCPLQASSSVSPGCADPLSSVPVSS